MGAQAAPGVPVKGTLCSRTATVDGLARGWCCSVARLAHVAQQRPGRLDHSAVHYQTVLGSVARSGQRRWNCFVVPYPAALRLGVLHFLAGRAFALLVRVRAQRVTVPHIDNGASKWGTIGVDVVHMIALRSPVGMR